VRLCFCVNWGMGICEINGFLFPLCPLPPLSCLPPPPTPGFKLAWGARLPVGFWGFLAQSSCPWATRSKKRKPGQYKFPKKTQKRRESIGSELTRLNSNPGAVLALCWVCKPAATMESTQSAALDYVEALKQQLAGEAAKPYCTNALLIRTRLHPPLLHQIRTARCRK
jgi:hypothetical protein